MRYGHFDVCDDDVQQTRGSNANDDGIISMKIYRKSYEGYKEK